MKRKPVVETPRYVKFVPSEIDLAPCFVLPDVTPREAGYYEGGDFRRDSGGYARVAVMQLYGPDQAIDHKSELWRVCVWGADDMGFEQDVPTLAEAVAIYNRINWVHGIKSILAEGFHYA